MTLSLKDLRRAAKRLSRAHALGEAEALRRLTQHPPRDAGTVLKHADFLHVIAKEQGFASWPMLKLAAETMGLDRAEKLQRLKNALFHGNTRVVESLLAQVPDLAEGHFGLQCALYRRDAVARALERDPGLATRELGPRRAILHLAFSRWIKAHPELESDMIAVAELLVAHGADVSDGFPHEPGSDHLLSALYGAIGHADNMVLGRWLLEQGANPNDNESLYHATELGHHEGLKMLLAAGARPQGTNALFRAMDFHDHAAVALLLDHGAAPDDYNEAEVGGEKPWVIRALHQAARRGCDARMVALLLEAGLDPSLSHDGVHPYVFARVHGSRPVAEALEARGLTVPLSPEEELMARAALDEPLPEGARIDPQKLDPLFADHIREILHLPGRLPVIRRLVALGLPFDKPDGFGLPPLHIAGWEGLPEVLAYLLSLGPDLDRVNGYGGTLLGTIIHGSENAPDRDSNSRDHLACLRLALEAGVPLPRRFAETAARDDVASFLEDWAEAHPEQLSEA